MKKSKVEIKICGITNVETALASHGAEYVGLVFYSKSSRHVSLPTAEKIISSLSKNQKKVGLFVNSKINIIKEISDHLDLDFIQLHGYEDIKFIQRLRLITNRKIIKAVPIKTIEDIKISEEFKNLCDMILFDTKSENQFGGSGKSFEWKLLENFNWGKKWMIAGGLNINNVKEAIEISKAPVVDISSGVEKNLELNVKIK